jgi:transposase InsO family protein
VKFAAIADWADSDEFPVDFMCRELGVSRSGYHARRGRTPSEREQADTALLAIIKGAYQRLRGNPGVRRIHAELRVLGHRLSRKRVWRLMQDADLQGRHPKAGKRTTVASVRSRPGSPPAGVAGHQRGAELLVCPHDQVAVVGPSRCGRTRCGRG